MCPSLCQSPGCGRPVRNESSLVTCWRRGEGAAGLAEMLAPGRGDQPVERVVGVAGRGLHPLVAEEDHVLGVGVVGDLGDVADRVVVVGQVLDGLLVGGERDRAGWW